jgi:hypothetical protein
MTEKIYATLIVEMMGRPQEHLQKAAEELIATMAKEKGIRITSKVLHELKKVENKDQQGKVIPVSAENQLYSTFAEIELECEDVLSLMSICFKYLPSHVEIIEPESMVMNNFELATMFNELITKMHNYDAIAKTALMQNQILAKKFQDMQKTGNNEIELAENITSEPEIKNEEKPQKKAKK